MKQSWVPRLKYGATVVVAAGVMGCSYDFDGAFAEDPLYGPADAGGDGSTTDGSLADGEDGDTGKPDVEGGTDACWPSCVDKCQGADDGCGNPCPQDDCGGTCCSGVCCYEGQVCDEGDACCSPGSCATLGFECGDHQDGCGGTVSCGDCSEGPCSSTGQCTGCPHAACSGACCDDGQICDSTGACCTPVTCGSLGVVCGTHDDGCGNPLACGVCAAGSYCLDGQACTPLTIRFRSLSGGTFSMGSPTGEPGRNDYEGYTGDLDETEHQVTLTRAFEIADVEVTQGDFRAVLGYEPSHFSNCGDDCPVEKVTWDEAARFCNELSRLKGLTPCFDCSGSGSSVSCDLAATESSPYTCTGYRLPTEAEWEYAARAGTQSAFHSGNLNKLKCDEVDPNLNLIGWYIANSDVTYAGGANLTCDNDTVTIGTHPVKSRQSNNFGLYDMAGNVWEWVFECGDSYPGGAQVDPLGPLSCNHRYKLYRGGGIGNESYYCRHAERADYTPVGGNNVDIGFRPVRTLP